MCLWCCRPQYPAGLPLLLAARDWFVSLLHPTIRASQYSMFGLTVHAVENWKDPQQRSHQALNWPDVLLYIVFPARTEGTHVFTICYWHPELKLGKWSWNSARSQTTQISNLSEVAELSSFCKSTFNNSTRASTRPCQSLQLRWGGDKRRRRFCWHMSVRVWRIQGVNTTNHRNDSLKYTHWCESGPSVPVNGTRQDILRCYIFRIWIMAVSVVAQIHTVMLANPSFWS